MKVLVFGASGGTGHELVEQGLARGHAITAFVRRPEKLTIRHENIIIHQGDVRDRASVESALQGRDAAISALGGASLIKRSPPSSSGSTISSQAWNRRARAALCICRPIPSGMLESNSICL